MEYRKLGKTNLNVSCIGLGTEYLYWQNTETAVSVIKEAFKGGINYFDLVFSFDDYLENMGKAFSKITRNKVILTGQIGRASCRERV